MTIQIKAIEQYFHVVVFVVPSILQSGIYYRSERINTSSPQHNLLEQVSHGKLNLLNTRGNECLGHLPRHVHKVILVES